MPKNLARQLDWATAARTVIDHILAAAERLTQFPFTGKIGKQPGIRELVLLRFPYTIFYQVKPAKIQVLRVLHQRRKFPYTV